MPPFDSWRVQRLAGLAATSGGGAMFIATGGGRGGDGASAAIERKQEKASGDHEDPSICDLAAQLNRG